MAVIVGGLVLQPGHIFLLHQHIAHLPVELNVVLLLPQLHQRVFLLILMLVLQVLNLVRSVLELLLLPRHNFARRFQFFGHRSILSFGIHDHVFLVLFLFCEFLRLFALITKLLLVLAPSSQLLCLFLLQLLTTHRKLVIKLIHHGF